MSVHMVEAKIKRESVTDVQAATKKMFEVVDAAQPDGIRYASCLLPDGETFLAFLEVSHLVHDFFHQTFQPSHLRLEARQRLLIRNGTVTYCSDLNRAAR